MVQRETTTHLTIMTFSLSILIVLFKRPYCKTLCDMVGGKSLSLSKPCVCYS